MCFEGGAMESPQQLRELYTNAKAGNKLAESLFFEIISERIVKFVRCKIRVASTDFESQNKLQDLVSDITLGAFKAFQRKMLSFDKYLCYLAGIEDKQIKGYFRRFYVERDRYEKLHDGSDAIEDHMASHQHNCYEELDAVKNMILQLPEKCQELFGALIADRLKEYVRERTKAGETRNEIDMRAFHCRKKLSILVQNEGHVS